MNLKKSTPTQRLLCVLLPAVLTAMPTLAQEVLTWQHAQTGIEFVWIKQGCFAMGAEQSGGVDQKGTPLVPRADEVPRHQVCVDGFWMGKHEVTREQWQRLMAPATPLDARFARRPAINVSWEDAQNFIQRLNASAAAGERFRLPTEAQWEYACQPGEPKLPVKEMRSERTAELQASAWSRHQLHEEQETRNVGELAVSPFGLYDMLGNVWEWTEDVYLSDGYAQHSRNNPKVASGSDRHVLRGGSYKSDVTQARCGARAYGVPNDRLPSVGLRVVREAVKGR